MACSVPVLLGFYLLTAPHDITGNFPLPLLFALAGNLFAFYGYVRAIELTDVSLVSPLLSLSPLFMLLTSWLMLSEFPDRSGLLGIIAVTTGTYFLAKDPQKKGLEPFRALLADAGVRWALVVSFVWSVTANIDKLAVRESTPIGYSFWFHVGFALLFLPMYLYFRDPETPAKNQNDDISWVPILLLGLLGAGFLQALMSGSQMYAIMQTDVAYIIAIKRAGMIVSVLAGGLILGESNFRMRLFATCIVFLGLLGIIF